MSSTNTQLPYTAICNGANTDASQTAACSSNKYICMSNGKGNPAFCTLKPQYTPYSIECGGSMNLSQREQDLCNSDNYICQASPNANISTVCTLH